MSSFHRGALPRACFRPSAGTFAARSGLAVALSFALAAPVFAQAQAPTSFDGPWQEAETPSEQILPTQVKAAYLLLEDLQGNRNGKVDDGARTDLSTAQMWSALDAFARSKAKAWGVSSVTDLGPKDFTSSAKYHFFQIEKSLFLDQNGWTPSQVKENFLSVTSASVEGQPVRDARVFVQTIEPAAGAPANKTVYAGLSGYENSHLDMYHVAKALVDRGATVVLGDQYWAGYTTGEDVHKGGVPSGETIALTMYDVAAWAKSTHPDRNLAIVGHSLGGGLGVWGMSYLNGKGQISAKITDKQGRTIAGSDLVPKSTPGAPLSAFLSPTPSAIDDVILAAGRVPGLDTLELSVPADDPTSLDQLKPVMLGTYRQPQAMDAVLPLATRIREAVANGDGPTNPMFSFHSFTDTLADFAPIQDLHDARTAQGLPSDLAVAPGNIHGVIGIPELARQAVSEFAPRVESWFEKGAADLSLHVASAVTWAQVPNKNPGFFDRIQTLIGNAIASFTGTVDKEDATLAKQVQGALDRFTRSGGQVATSSPDNVVPPALGPLAPLPEAIRDRGATPAAEEPAVGITRVLGRELGGDGRAGDR